MNQAPVAAIALCFALGCGAEAGSAGTAEPNDTAEPSNTAEPGDTVGPGGTEGGSSSNEPIGGATDPGTTPGFVDAPIVRFPAPAVNSGSSVVCVEAPRQVSVAEASALGVDVAADRAMLERTWDGDVLVSREQVAASRLHVRSQLERVWLVEHRAIAQGAASSCPSFVRYEVAVQLYTEDGSLSGTFLSSKRATPVGEAPQPFLEAESDLRNFTGTLPVAWDGDRDVFGTAQVYWGFEQPGAEVFDFEARVWHSALGSCSEPDCNVAAASSEHLSVGVHTGETQSFGDLLADLGGYVRSPVTSTLSQFAASMGPYQRNVSAWVVARAAPATQVQLRTSVNEVVSTSTLDLAHDELRFVDGVVAGWLDLGPLAEGTPVSFVVEGVGEVGGPSPIVDLQSRVYVGGCNLAAAYDRCQDPGCVARSALTVVSAACARNVE